MVFIQLPVVDNQVFQSNLVLSETVTLSSTQQRVTVMAPDTTSVSISDDDGIMKLLFTYKY